MESRKIKVSAKRPKPAPVWAVDFDGTLCENRWPNIGLPNSELIALLRVAQRRGTKLILWTCREGEALDEAVAWCREQGLVFDSVNENLPSRVAYYRNNPRKIGADLYIDDRSCAPPGKAAPDLGGLLY